MADANIPRFRAERAAVPGTYDKDRRPGSSGQRYFSDVRYANPNMAPREFDEEASGYETQAAYDTRFDNSMDAAVNAARDTNTAQANQLGIANLANPARGTRPSAQSFTAAEIVGMFPSLQEMMGPYYNAFGETNPEGIAGLLSAQESLVAEAAQTPSYMAQGGNVNGYYLGGATDGMADQIPAAIDNRQPAALSDGEFVIPADVVSHLGNGNSNAGATELYGMMDKIRKARTGNTNQGREINPNKFLA